MSLTLSIFYPQFQPSLLLDSCVQERHRSYRRWEKEWQTLAVHLWHRPTLPRSLKGWVQSLLFRKSWQQFSWILRERSDLGGFHWRREVHCCDLRAYNQTVLRKFAEKSWKSSLECWLTGNIFIVITSWLWKDLQEWKPRREYTTEQRMKKRFQMNKTAQKSNSWTTWLLVFE